MSEKTITAVEQLPEAVIVHVLVSDLTEDHVARLRGEIAAADKPTLPLVLDLEKVKLVPSVALGVLVRLASEFRSRGQRLVFVSLQPRVRKLLAITRLDRSLEILDDIPAAKRSLGIGG